MTLFEKKKISRYNRAKSGDYLMYSEIGSNILVKKIGGVAELKDGEYLGKVVSVVGNIPFYPNVKHLNVLKEIKY